MVGSHHKAELPGCRSKTSIYLSPSSQEQSSTWDYVISYATKEHGYCFLRCYSQEVGNSPDISMHTLFKIQETESFGLQVKIENRKKI